MAKNPPSNAGDTDSIPGQGPKIPHATGKLSLSGVTREACAPQRRHSAVKITNTWINKQINKEVVGLQLDLREIFWNMRTTKRKGYDYVIFKREDWPINFLKQWFRFWLTEGGNRQNRLHLESRTPSWAGLWTLNYMLSIYGNNIPTGKPDPPPQPPTPSSTMEEPQGSYLDSMSPKRIP